MYNSRRSGFRRSHTATVQSVRDRSPAPLLMWDSGVSNPVTILSDDVNVKMSVLDRKIADLEQLFEHRRIPTFDNTELELCDHDIQRVTGEISQRISALTSEIKRPINMADHVVVNLLVNLQQCHRLRLGSIVQRFRNLQARQRPANIPSDERSDPIYEMYADFHPQMSLEQAALMHSTEEMTAHEDELRGLVVMMNELNTMFRDVSLLIFEQGTVLDRIDTRISVAVEDVERGNEELRAASEHQKSSCFYWYIGCVMGMIGICLLVMIFRIR